MTKEDDKFINDIELEIGKKMDSITFCDLLRELTGTSIDDFFKGFAKDKKDEKSNLE